MRRRTHSAATSALDTRGRELRAQLLLIQGHLRWERFARLQDDVLVFLAPLEPFAHPVVKRAACSLGQRLGRDRGRDGGNSLEARRLWPEPSQNQEMCTLHNKEARPSSSNEGPKSPPSCAGRRGGMPPGRVAPNGGGPHLQTRRHQAPGV